MDALFDIAAVKCIGIIMVIVGIGLRYYLNSIHRYRGSPQHCNTDADTVASSLSEKVLKCVWLILLVVGLFFVLMNWFNYRDVEKSGQPQQATEMIES